MTLNQNRFLAYRVFNVICKGNPSVNQSLLFQRPSANLCDVITIDRPSARTFESASHNNLLATGSIPVVGSSRKTTGGSPTRDIAVLNFRLLPPLNGNYVTRSR